MGKTRSTLIMDEDLWKRFRMIAILNNMEVSELVDQALREKLERMKQLEQYPEYKDVRNLRVHKGEQPQQLQQQQQQNQDIFKEDRSRPRLRKGEVVFPFRWPGFIFPTTKEKILQYLKEDTKRGRRNHEIELLIVRRLPDDKKEYNQVQLEGALSRLIYHKGKLTIQWPSDGTTDKVVGVGIDTKIYPHDKEPSTMQPSNYPIIVAVGKDQYEFHLTIPELTFPTDKAKIIKNLQETMDEVSIEPESDAKTEVLSIMKINLDIISRLLPKNKKYTDVAQIEEDIVNSPKEELSKYYIKPGKLVGCKINWGPDITKKNMGMKVL